MILFELPTFKLDDVFPSDQDFMNDFMASCSASFENLYLDFDSEGSLDWEGEKTILFINSVLRVYKYFKNYFIEYDNMEQFKTSFLNKIENSYSKYFPYFQGKNLSLDNKALGAFNFDGKTPTTQADSPFSTPEKINNYSFKQASGLELQNQSIYQEQFIKSWINEFEDFFQNYIGD